MQSRISWLARLFILGMASRKKNSFSRLKNAGATRAIKLALWDETKYKITINVVFCFCIDIFWVIAQVKLNTPRGYIKVIGGIQHSEIIYCTVSNKIRQVWQYGVLIMIWATVYDRYSNEKLKLFCFVQLSLSDKPNHSYSSIAWHP